MEKGGQDSSCLTAMPEPTYANDTDIETKCQPWVEKGARVSARVPVTTPEDRPVQVQEQRIQFGKMLTSAGRKLMDVAGTTAYFQRVDGSIVQAKLNIVATPDGRVTAATHDRAESLVPGLRDAPVAFAADPRVGPATGPATGRAAAENPGQPTQHEQNQAYLQETLGSPTFGLSDGVVTLQNNRESTRTSPARTSPAALPLRS